MTIDLPYIDSTVTITIAAPGVVTWAAHGLSINDTIRFTTSGALPTGLSAGTTYYIEAATYFSTDTGALRLNFRNQGDDFHTPLLLSYDDATQPYAVATDTSDFSSASDDPVFNTCSGGGLESGLATAWHKFTPAVSDTLVVDTIGSDYDTILGVWEGTRGSLSELACDDDSAGSLKSRLRLGVTAGTTYYIEVAQFNGYIDPAPGMEPKPIPDLATATTSGEKALGEDVYTLGGGGRNLALNLRWAAIAPPTDFGKTTPADLLTGLPTNPSLSWQAATGADFYTYCYDTSDDGVCDEWLNNGLSTSVTLSGLDRNTTYYWQIRAINELDGDDAITYADNDHWWEFTTAPLTTPPGNFSKTYPGNSQAQMPVNAALVWGAAADAESYAYCYDTTNDDACADWVSTGKATSVSLQGLKNQTTYYWQARATNLFGDTIANSGAWWSFTTIESQRLTLKQKSNGLYDGWILETGERSSRGGVINATGSELIIGDDPINRQYRAILSFDTQNLPDEAVLVSATLKIKRKTLVGTNLFKTHTALVADIRKPYFATNVALSASDFQYRANLKAVASFSNFPTLGWHSATLSTDALRFINKTGTTQFRLRWLLDDNNDGSSDYYSFYSGNASAASRPVLVIDYYLP